MKRPLVLLIVLFLLAVGGSLLAILDHDGRASRESASIGPERGGNAGRAQATTAPDGEEKAAVPPAGSGAGKGSAANGSGDQKAVDAGVGRVAGSGGFVPDTSAALPETARSASERAIVLIPRPGISRPGLGAPIATEETSRRVGEQRERGRAVDALAVRPPASPSSDTAEQHLPGGSHAGGASQDIASDAAGIVSIDRGSARATTGLALVPPRLHRDREPTMPAQASSQGLGHQAVGPPTNPGSNDRANPRPAIVVERGRGEVGTERSIRDAAAASSAAAPTNVGSTPASVPSAGIAPTEASQGTSNTAAAGSAAAKPIHPQQAEAQHTERARSTDAQLALVPPAMASQGMPNAAGESVARAAESISPQQVETRRAGEADRTEAHLALVPPAARDPLLSSALGDTRANTDDRDIAALNDGASPPLHAGPGIPPTFDIVRVEPTGEAVLAGRAAPGASVEVLSDEKVVARAKADDGGGWVAVPDAPLTPGNHDLSLEAKRTNGVEQVSQERVAVAVPEKRGDGVLVVVGRAGAPSRVLAKPDASTEVDALPAPLNIARAETSAGPGGSAEANAAAPPVLTVEAVEAEGGTLYVAGASAPNALVRVYVDDIHVGDATAGPSGRWLLESDESLPAKGLTLTIRADRLRTGGSRVEARALVPFIRRLDNAALMPAAAVAAGSGATSSGGRLPEPAAIIIRRGDNLWTISRRAYGRGVRYTTIYGANAEQIRDPDLIYPGQVFVMPTGDRTWTE